MLVRQMREACHSHVNPIETETLWHLPWILGLSVWLSGSLSSSSLTCSFSLSSPEEKTLVQVRAPEVGGVSI